MANKFVLNSAGVREMLQSEEMKSVCEEYAQQIQASLGSDYEMTSDIGTSRARATLKAVTNRAIKDNYENNTLLKAVDHD